MNAERKPLLVALSSAHVRLGLAAVCVAGLVLTIVSVLTLRTYVDQNLTLVARSIAYSAEAAVVFEDSAAATELVTLIARKEGLLSAGIVARNGVRMATYARQNGSTMDEGLARVGTLLFPVEAMAPITHQDAVIGTVTVQGNGSVYLMFLAKGLAGIVACMVVIGWWVARLSRRIERDIVEPLNRLAALTRTARTQRALDLRAPPAFVQEIHTLGEDFNALLAEIHSREAELTAEHDDLRTANESLSYLAFHDSLTGLPNRASFVRQASRALLASRGDGSIAAVLYIDSDDFKTVNDRLGHAAGDELLVEIARRLRVRRRETDVVARLGGDEFAVLVSGLRSVDEAARTGREVAAALRERVTSPRLGAIDVSASVGVAVYPLHGATVEALLLAADAAMYRAKTGASGSSCVFDLARDGRTSPRAA